MLSILPRTLAVAALVLLVGAPSGGRADSAEEEALIGGGEGLGTHAGSAGQIGDHEGKAGDIHNREAAAGRIQDDEARSGSLADHAGHSGNLESQESGSERLSGVENDPSLALSKARQNLLDARQRHAREVKAAEAEASRPATAERQRTSGASDGHQTWSHRLELAKHRILVAEAQVRVMDTAYADMIRTDYPRGDARQQLIDQRQQAAERLKSEQARLPQLVARARQEGVPPGALSDYSD
jgi:hypothetical protein